MTRVALTGGAYQARSLIAAAQRQLNLFSEPVPQQEGEPDSVALFPTAGLRMLATLPQGPVRGIRSTTSGAVYVVAGSGVYAIASDWTYTQIGSITVGPTTPVSMADNGLQLVIVDGSASGWQVTLATNAFAPIVNPNQQAYRYWQINVTASAYGAQIAMAEVQLLAGGVNVLGSGTASASDTTAGYPAAQACDGNAATCWISASKDAYWQYDFGATTFEEVTSVVITARNDANWTMGPQNFTVQCSNDNSTWQVAGTFTAQSWTQGQTQTYAVTPPATVSPFQGADRADYLDTFFLFNVPGTPQFQSSLSLSTNFDPLYFANKEAYSDLLVTLVVAKREIWLLGTATTEVWYNSGASTFPFESQPGVFIDRGCCAKYSAATADNAVYWLSQDRTGHGLVLQGAGYQATRVSTYAIEAALSTYPKLSDAVGYTYQLAGHLYYVLNFPSADKTWAYDITTKLWHELCWLDSNGLEHRHRANCATAAYGVVACGDWSNGNLYALDPAVYTDAGAPIKRLRSFPHLLASGKRVFYRQFLADMEAGTGPHA